MARGAAGLLALALCAAGSARAQLRPVEVPVSGRAGIDSLALLGFEVASVRVDNGSLRAVIVVSPETELPPGNGVGVPEIGALTAVRVPVTEGR